MEIEFHPPQPYLIPAVERMWLPWRQPLLVDVGVVGAVQVLNGDLGALDEDASVPAGDTSLIPAVVGQVNIREDIADRVLPSEDDLGPAGREG